MQVNVPCAPSVLSTDMFRAARGITFDAFSGSHQGAAKTSAGSDSLLSLLESQSDRELHQGLQNVVSAMARGVDVKKYFASIATHVTCADIHIRRLVYAYLVQYADKEPELALMTVNGIRKFLSDSNAEARALSLKTLSSFKIPSLAPIIALSIKELLYDHAPIVRMSCCNALGKCFQLEPSMGPELLEQLMVLTGDTRDPYVHGYAMAALAIYWPTRLELLHNLYFDYCRCLPRYASWCQVVTLKHLLIYTRTYCSPGDPDLKELLTACQKLLSSLDSSVVIQAGCMFHYLGSNEEFSESGVAGALVRTAHTEISLKVLVPLIRLHRDAFEKHINSFIPLPSDQGEIIELKLTVLALLVDESTAGRIFSEMQFSTKYLNSMEQIRQAMTVVATCAARKPRLSSKIRHWLLECISVPDSSSEHLTSEALAVLRMLVSDSDQGKTSRASLLWTLHGLVGSSHTNFEAKEYFIWMLGEYCDEHPKLACELLRQCLISHKNQPAGIRYQTIQLAAKLFALYDSKCPDSIDSRVPEMFSYAIQLGRYDTEFDVRDRARTFSMLLDPDSADLARLMLRSPKVASLERPKTEEGEDFVFNTVAQALGHSVIGYKGLPNWGCQASSLRRCKDEASARNQPTETAPLFALESGTGSTSKEAEEPSRSLQKQQIPSLEEFLGSDSLIEETESETDSELEGVSEHDEDDNDRQKIFDGVESERNERLRDEE